MTLREQVLETFGSYSLEEKLNEYTAYKNMSESDRVMMGISNDDLLLMEMATKHPGLFIECGEEGCSIINSQTETVLETEDRMDEGTADNEKKVASAKELIITFFEEFYKVEHNIPGMNTLFSNTLIKEITNLHHTTTEKSDILFHPLPDSTQQFSLSIMADKKITSALHMVMNDIDIKSLLNGEKGDNKSILRTLTHIKGDDSTPKKLLTNVSNIPFFLILLKRFVGAQSLGSDTEKYITELKDIFGSTLSVNHLTDEKIKALSRKVNAAINNIHTEIKNIIHFKSQDSDSQAYEEKVSEIKKKIEELDGLIGNATEEDIRSMLVSKRDIEIETLTKLSGITIHKHKEKKVTPTFSDTIDTTYLDILNKNGVTSEQWNSFKQTINKKLGTQLFSKKYISILNSALDGTFTDDTYTEQIHRTIKELFNNKGTGYGKGELFHHAVVEGCAINGGSTGYDLDINGSKFEVKAYPVVNETLPEPIRLGAEGSTLRFEEYSEIITYAKMIGALLSPDNIIFLSGMGSHADISSDEFDKLLKELSDSWNNGSYDYIAQLRKGEFTTTRIVELDSIFKRMKILLQSIHDNNFQYAKIIGNKKDELYAIIPPHNVAKKDTDSYVSIKELDAETKESELTCIVKKVDTKSEQKVKEIVTALIGSDILTKDNYLHNAFTSITAEINKMMEEHPMILLSDPTNELSSNEYKIYGVYKTFDIVLISQSGIKICPTELNTEKLKMAKSALIGQ